MKKSHAREQLARIAYKAPHERTQQELARLTKEFLNFIPGLHSLMRSTKLDMARSVITHVRQRSNDYQMHIIGDCDPVYLYSRRRSELIY